MKIKQLFILHKNRKQSLSQNSKERWLYFVCLCVVLRPDPDTSLEYLYMFLFVCVEFIVPLERIFSLIWRRHYCRWWAANFDLCSALVAIEQWGFFNVPHLLRHWPTFYNGHLRGPVTLAPVTERLAVELSLPFLTTQVCRDRGSNPDLPHASIYTCNRGRHMKYVQWLRRLSS